MALDMTMLQGMGLEEILLWLLSFAIVFGILSQVEIPKNKGTRGMIAIVIAFFALFAAAGTGLIAVLSNMSIGLLLIILGVIVFIVFLETAGVRITEYHPEYEKDPRTKGKVKAGETSIIKKHPLGFAAALIILALIVFIGAGGLNLLGFNVTLGKTNTTTLFFFGVIVLAIIWLIANPGE